MAPNEFLPEFIDAPGFSNRILPPGDYPLTLDQLMKSMLVIGPRPRPHDWNTPWRRNLVLNLGVLVGQLRQVGITDIFVDGSFTHDKGRPGDIDGYFVCDRNSFQTGVLEVQLNLLDPHRIWTWSRRRWDPVTQKHQLPMWHKYHVELYPHYAGGSSDIKDEHGHPQEFPAAFRKTRVTHTPKGIIRLIQ